MKMNRVERRFVNSLGHSRRVAEGAVRRLRDLAIEPGWLYLDVGCGNGEAARRVADTYGLHVTGVDVDHHQIEQARLATHERSDAVFLLADAADLPFENGCFDVVATNKVTHHMPAWQAGLREMERVLKPGGYFVYADLSAPAWLAAFLKRAAGGKAGIFTAEDLDRLFAGFRPVRRDARWWHYEGVFVKSPLRRSVADA